jgi:hypothetical protein
MNLNEGLVIVVVASLVLELIVCLCCRRWFSFLMAVAIPFIVTVSLFWLPRLDQVQNHEARGWFVIFFIYWFVPSGTTCLALAAVLTWLRHRADRNKNATVETMNVPISDVALIDYGCRMKPIAIVPDRPTAAT